MPLAAGKFGLHQHQRRGAVVDAAGVAGGHGGLLVFGEGGPQFGECFHGGAGSRMFVRVKVDRVLPPLRHIDGEQFVVEEVHFVGERPPLLTEYRKSILLVTADVELPREILGRFAHAVRMMHLGECRVGEPPPDRRVVHVEFAIKGPLALGHDEGSAAHALDAAGDEHISAVCFDHPRGDVDCFEPRSAQPVDGASADADRKARKKGGHAGDVAVVFARLIRRAEVDIFDRSRIDACSLHGVLDGMRGQIIRPDTAQDAAIAAKGRAKGGNDGGATCHAEGDCSVAASAGRPRWYRGPVNDYQSKVQQLASEAMQIPETGQDAWLADVCGGDEALIEDVRSEVRMMSGEDATLESGSGDHTPMPTIPAASSRLPESIGEFTVRRLLGVGGMGIVYEAAQSSPQRRVAVKVMKHGVASGSALRRFQMEAQTLGRLHHSGIAQIYEAGTWDDGSGGVPYFAMEYIVGAKSLTAYAAEKNLSISDRIELFTSICDAIHHGHQKGIIHRDLKPGNILVDRQGNCKVIDFGVARSTDADIAVTTQQTDVGAIVGTLQYMSPEQCQADPDLIDTRCDVYALGVLLYELLAEQVPYELKGLPIYEAAKVVREESPTRMTTINSSLKGDLETIVSKAMVKDPDHRYQSALELKQDLERYLKGDPISARPLSLTYQLSLLVRRNRAAVVGVLAVAAVLVLATILSVVLAVRANLAEDAAIAAQVQAEAELSKSKAGQEFLAHILGMASPRNAQGRTLNTRQVLREAAVGIDTRFAGLPELAAETRLTIGELMFELQMFDDADQQLTSGMAAIEALHGPDDSRILHALAVMGRMRTDQGRPRQADQVTLDAIERARRALPENDPILIEAMASRVLALVFLTRFSEAVELSGEWLDTARRRYDDEHPQTLEAMTHHAYMLMRLSSLESDEEARDRMLEDGTALLQSASETSERILGGKHPITLQANAFLALRRWVSAADEQREDGQELALYRATEALQNVLGEDHAVVLEIVHLHGVLMFMVGAGTDDDELVSQSEVLLSRAYDGYQRRFGPDNPLTQEVMIWLGQARTAISGEIVAVEALRGTYEQLLAQHAPDHHSVINARANLAVMLLQTGNIAEGEPLLQTTIEHIAAILGPYHIQISQCKALLVEAFLEHNQIDRGLAETKAWLSEIQSHFGIESKEAIQHQVAAARCFERAERRDESLSLFEKASDAARTHLDPGSDIRAEAVRHYAAALLTRDQPEPAMDLIDEAIEHSDAEEEPDPANVMRLQVLRADALVRLDRDSEARTIVQPLLVDGEDDPSKVLEVVAYMLARESLRLLELDVDAVMAAALRSHERGEEGSGHVVAKLYAARGEHAEAVRWQEQVLAEAKPREREDQQERLDEYRAAQAEAIGDSEAAVDETEEVVETPTP